MKTAQKSTMRQSSMEKNQNKQKGNNETKEQFHFYFWGERETRKLFISSEQQLQVIQISFYIYILYIKFPIFL